MKMPNNGEYRVLIEHLLSPSELSSTGMGLHLISCWPMGYSGNPQISPLLPRQQAALHKLIAKLLSKTTPTQLLNMEKQSWYLHRAFTPEFQHPWYRIVFYRLSKEKRKHQCSHKPLEACWKLYKCWSWKGMSWEEFLKWSY